VLHGDQRGCQASRTARALGMSDLRLQSRHWDFLGTITKSQLERSSFHTIVHLSGSSVQVHVVNVLGCQSGLFKRECDCAGRFFGRLTHAHPVKGLAGGGVSDNLGVDASASGAGRDHNLQE